MPDDEIVLGEFRGRVEETTGGRAPTPPAGMSARGSDGVVDRWGRTQLESEVLTRLNELLTDVPNVLTIVTLATIIRASMTAYSTAVGPSSDSMNRSKP